MKFDVVVVTYNSARWLGGCVAALAGADFDASRLNLIFVDNHSTDDSLSVLEALGREFPGFGGFRVLPQGENLGFSRGCNAGAAAGEAPVLFFLNADTEVHPGVFARLEHAIGEAGPEYAAFECRQLPYEHPKYYSPVTGETGWASGAALAVRREVFAQVGGFDESIFMYCEDVDLSWRIRLAGYRLRYLPEAMVRHYAYRSPGEQKPLQTAGHLAGDYLLRLKYGSRQDRQKWRLRLEQVQPGLDASPEAARLLRQRLAEVRRRKGQYRRFYRKNVKKSGFAPQFCDGDYAYTRPGAFCETRPVEEGPFFSVLVRTYKRPELLRQTLESLARQTYKNFEVVVVEDGPSTAGEMLENGFEGLKLRYHATGEEVGRCRTGNLACEMAKGSYLNFLDDDDHFFADHLETMAALIASHPEGRLFAAGSLQAQCAFVGGDATRWEIRAVSPLSQEGYSFADVAYWNPFPIQAVAFHREVFEALGGLDPALDALEDWELWVRYACRYPVFSTEKGTSLFKVPADPVLAAKRLQHVRAHMPAVLEKFAAYSRQVPAADITRIHTKAEDEAYFKQVATAEECQKAAFGIYRSTFWRLTKPLRSLQKALEGPAEAGNAVIYKSPEDFLDIHEYLLFCHYARSSLGWRATAPLRRLLNRSRHKG